jgi:hypothetical protein
MPWQAWLLLVAAIVGLGGIFVIEKFQRARDLREIAENERRRDQDADWFI